MLGRHSGKLTVQQQGKWTRTNISQCHPWTIQKKGKQF